MSRIQEKLGTNRVATLAGKAEKISILFLAGKAGKAFTFDKHFGWKAAFFYPGVYFSYTAKLAELGNSELS